MFYLLAGSEVLVFCSLLLRLCVYLTFRSFSMCHLSVLEKVWTIYELSIID